MKRRCRDWVLQVLLDNPHEWFDAVSVGRVLEVKHNVEFAHGTIDKALRDLWKDRLIEGVVGPVAYFAPKREPTDDEKRALEEKHAAWQEHIKAEWEAKGWGLPPSNLSGPPGLHPDDLG